MITQERLKEVLDYNESTGVFTRKLITNNKQKVGEIVGYKTNTGYNAIGLDGKSYLAHRLVCLYLNGEFPPNDVDHINGNRLDNRWCNLRLATRAENCMNSKKRVTNTTGRKGVTKHHNKFRASIWAEGKKKYLGLYDTVEEAHNAYCESANIFFGKFHNTGEI